MIDISQFLDKLLRSAISYLVFALMGVLGTILVVTYGSIVGLVSYLLSLLVVLALFLVLVQYRRTLRVLSSGARGYYFTFPSSENAKVRSQATRSFKYMGVSGDSIGLREFLSWINGLPRNSPLRCSFLLMDPNGSALFLQKAHQKGMLPDDPGIKAEVDADRDRIRSSIALLKTSSAYKEGRLQIKVYDEFVPWWMYLLDDEKIFLGVLPRGGSGLEAPVLTMEHNRKFPSIFDPFMNMWERMWNGAKDA